MRRLWQVVMAVTIGASLPAWGEGIALAPPELSIRPGETKRLEFGNVPQRDTTVRLELSARLHYSRLGGSMHFLRLSLNGRDVTAARSRSLVRLVNKPVVSPVAPGMPATWFGGQAGWRLVYAPDFEAARKAKYYADDPYRLVFDITDLVNPAAENRLELTNTARPNPDWKSPVGHVIIGRMTVQCVPGASPMMSIQGGTEVTLNRGRPGAGSAEYKGRLAEDGELTIQVGKQQWRFCSSFSYPDAGYNCLGQPVRSVHAAESNWKPKVTASPEGGAIRAEGNHYRLQRLVRFLPRRIEVADTLTNLRKQALGMAVRHEVDLGGLKDPPARLAGNPDPSVQEYYSAHNPTVHVGLSDQGLGLVCEDDLFRNQARLYCTAEPPVAGLRTEMLRLGPAESLTLRWSIYPVASGDYFDFINLVREDWGANFTVDGAWSFFNPDTILSLPAEKLRQQYARLGIRYAIYCGGWVDYKTDRTRIGFGTGVLDDYWNDFRRRLKEATAKLHASVPGLKVMIYYDTQRDTSEGGVERFRDSWLTNATGQQLVTDWGGRYSRTWSVVATLKNSFGKAMLSAADRYLGELGVDGLYWDEMENVAYGAPLLTYNATDGHTCLLDPKRFTIQREVGLTTLLGESHRLAVIERARQRGACLMGNGPACTRGLLATGVPRMVEIQHNDFWCYEGNLGTPLGYLSGQSEFKAMVRALRLGCLPVGTRYDYSHEISAHLFPFTPIELHTGYLLGRERIIAVHAGEFGWPGERSLVEVRHFNVKGIRTAKDFPTRITTEARTAVAPAEDEAVVLVRLPASLEPGRGQVTAEKVSYGPNSLELTVSCEQPCVVRLRNGAFPIEDGRRYRATIGTSTEICSASNGILEISIPAGREQRIRLAIEAGTVGPLGR